MLHVFGALSVGGAESWLAQALPAADEGPWEMEFVLLAGREGPFAEGFRRRGYQVRHCSLKPLISFPIRFRRLLIAGRFDGVHSHVLWFSGFIAALAAMAGVPLRIAHAHNDSDGWGDGVCRQVYRRLMRALLWVSDATVFGCTDRAAKVLSRRRERIQVIPYGVDLSPFERRGDRRSARAALGIGDGVRVVGHCGRMAEQKNQDFLLRVVRRAAELDPALLLLIAGEGELRTRLEGLAQSLGIADRVRFLGLRGDAPRLMTDVFDAFVLPSRHEGLPVSLIEAQAAGLPCLVSDRVNPETIVDLARTMVLPLERGERDWAAALLRAVRIEQEPPETSVARVAAAGFDAADSRRRLFAAYAAAWRKSTGSSARASAREEAA